MKRFAIGMSLLAALLAVSVASGSHMERLCRPVVQNLEQAVGFSAAGAAEAAEEAVDRARELWNRGWKYMAAVADHEPLAEVDALFEEAAAYGPESEDFAACCRQLLQRTAAVIRELSIRWWNLL